MSTRSNPDHAPQAMKAVDRMAETLASQPRTGIISDTGLHYLRYGCGTPVVFLHGLGACKELWWTTFRMLAPEYDCLTFELPGHGASPAPSTYDLEALAALVLDSCSASGVDTFTLVGHSLGGNIAVRMALAAPTRVTRLVLVDAALDAGDFALWRGRRPPPYTERTHRALRRLTRPLAILGQQVSPDVVGGMIRPLARRLHAWQPVTAEVMRGYLAAIWADPLGKRLATIRQPTLIVQGTRDPLVLGRQARRAVACIQGARLNLIRGAFHTPMDEKPAAFVTILRDFLAEPGIASLH
jgi:pimeloyl-ACP methyl ester carboxylesterase